MSVYNIVIHFDDETKDNHGFTTVLRTENPYEAAFQYDVKNTFVNILDDEEFCEMDGHEGELAVYLYKDGNSIRSKLHFLDEDPEKTDKRVSKIINF